METLTLNRLRSGKDGTFGELIRHKDGSKQLCVTVEPPWKDNWTAISCIPKGIYTCTRSKSPTKNKKLNGEVFRLHSVPNRENILIHTANWARELKGCIAPGEEFSELDGVPAVIRSTDAMAQLLAVLPDEFQLEVIGVVG